MFDFNNLDIIIIVIYFIFFIRGINKGFIGSLLLLIIIAGSLFGSFYLSKFLQHTNIPFIAGENTLITVVASFFILIFAGLYLQSFFIETIERVKLFSIIDKFLGGILGILKATLIVFGVCYILMFFSDTTFVKESKIFPYIEHYSSILIKNVD